MSGRQHAKARVPGRHGSSPLVSIWPSWASIMLSLTRKERKYWASDAADIAPSTLWIRHMNQGGGRT